MGTAAAWALASPGVVVGDSRLGGADLRARGHGGAARHRTRVSVAVLDGTFRPTDRAGRTLRAVSSDAGSGSLDLLASSLRADLSDLNAFFETLASKLEDALPGNVRVDRWRARMLGPKYVRKIVVDAGGERLELARGEGERVQALRGRISGGIVIKSEPLEIDQWIDALIEVLTAEAGRNEKTRLALERLLLAS